MNDKSKILTKKGLKNFIKQNGFFIQVRDLEKVETDAARAHLDTLDDSVKTKINLPKDSENIQVFKGLASQFYGKGKKSRNGYKYEHKGMDLTNYKKKPLILLQHDSNKPIGFALSLEFKEGVGLEITYFIDYNTKAAKENEHELRNGYIGMLSTGAITHEWMVEDVKTGKLMTPSEANEAGVDLWGVIFGMSDDYIMVVTKSELVENSQVTIGSNENAQTKGDSLSDFFTNELEKMNIKKPATDDTDHIEINEVEAETPEAEAEEPEVVETPEVPEADAVEEEAEEVEPVTDTAGNPSEAPEEPAENADEPVTAEADAEEPVVEPENGEAEVPEVEEVVEDPVAEKNALNLVEMTKSLAENLLELEADVNASKEGNVKADELDEKVQTAVNAAVAEQNKVLQAMADTVVSLSNNLQAANDRLDKVAVNKPHVVHRQLEAAKEARKDTWA